DLRPTIAIHNAVNETVLKENKKWVAGWSSEKFGGLKLASCSGDSQKLILKARFIVLSREQLLSCYFLTA
ncbi:hypothetical protein HOY80DRAFT_881751, partial [Tuber brumale]